MNIGDVIANRYEIRSFLGEGGMQHVFLALDKSFERLVALKVPKVESASKRFERSAILSARVVHPNVAATLDYLSLDKSEYLVEEYVEGKDLSVRIEQFKLLDPHLTAHVAHHLARALSASHRVGVFHRDLKPSNIIVSDDPGMSRIKITDFGIAKLALEEFEEALSDGSEASITGSQTVLGALPYMAPESFTDNYPVGLPADVWSLGAILFQLLFGERPFGGGPKAVAKTIASIVKGSIQPKFSPLHKMQQFKRLNDELWGIVADCMKVDPSQRPSADALLTRLSTLCYSTAPRKVGTIAEFRGGTGNWGKIRDGGELYFFHRDSFYGTTLAKDEPVNFAYFQGSPLSRAMPVIPIKT